LLGLHPAEVSIINMDAIARILRRDTKVDPVPLSLIIPRKMNSTNPFNNRFPAVKTMQGLPGNRPAAVRYGL